MSEICLGCMVENNGEDVCPNCGFDKHSEQLPPYLPLRTVLQNRYIVGKVVYNNTECAKYMGYDKFENTPVIIREFFPYGLCTRTSASLEAVVQPEKQDLYKSLENNFLQVHRNVARFKELSAIVAVYDIFHENNTAYVIEETEEIIPLHEYIERSGGTLEWDTARPLFMPLLSALSKIHQSGLAHYGIAPENLVITPSGKMKILNFSVHDLRRQGGALEAQLFTGCSAPEQYNNASVLGEYTDIYGFTATLFFALTGKLPADARKRMQDGRLLINTNVVKRLPPHVITALANGLQVDRQSRIADFESLRAQLSAAPTVKAIQEEIARPAVIPPTGGEEGGKRRVSNFACGVIATAVALVVFSVAGFFWVASNPFQGMFVTSGGSTEETGATQSTTSQSEDFTYPQNSEYFRVRNFVGMKYEDVEKLAENSTEYYVLRTTEDEFSNTVAEGYIISQTPEGNTTVDRGNDGVTISVTVSKGPQTRELPEVENLTLDDAAKALNEEHFIANTQLEFSDEVPENTVIGYAQGFKEGQKLDYGSEVTVIVSLGPKPDLSSQSGVSTAAA